MVEFEGHQCEDSRSAVKSVLTARQSARAASTIQGPGSRVKSMDAKPSVLVYFLERGKSCGVLRMCSVLGHGP